MNYQIDTSKVHFGDIELPRIHGRGIVTVDLKGKTLNLGPNSGGITTPTNNPLTDTSTRYIIRNGIIAGGKTAVNLSATFGSKVEDLELVGQSEVSLKASFALSSRFLNILVTNPKGHGIWLGTGSFGSWGTQWNSQCNSSILENCRVYNSGNMVGNSFTIMHSNGVQLRNCISEGHSHDGWCLYYDGANSTVKSFLVDGFHMEHSSNPKKGGIFLRAMANSPIMLRQLFIQGWGSQSPAVYAHSNPVVIFEQIGWWTNRMQIETSHRAPRLKSRDCHPALNTNRIKFDGNLFQGYLNWNA